MTALPGPVVMSMEQKERDSLRAQASARRLAFTLVEVLVVVAILSTLFAILLPAVQTARESARLSQCRSRLRQLTLGVLQFEARQGEFPPAYTEPDVVHPERPKHNFVPFLLADIEQQSLAEKYSLEYDWFESLRPTPESSNRKLAETPIDLLRCPSTPMNSLSGVADYAVCTAMDQATNSTLDGNKQPALKRLLQAGHITMRSSWNSILTPVLGSSGEYRCNTRRNVIDGLSQSMMLFEDAGRPELYIAGVRVNGSGFGPIAGAQWADIEAPFSIHDLCGKSMMNCNNENEIYSFHRNGCNFAFGDGNVRFLTQQIDPEVFVSLLTCNAEDVVKEISL